MAMTLAGSPAPAPAPAPASAHTALALVLASACSSWHNRGLWQLWQLHRYLGTNQRIGSQYTIRRGSDQSRPKDSEEHLQQSRVCLDLPDHCSRCAVDGLQELGL